MNKINALIFTILFFGCQSQNKIFTFTAIPDQDTARLEERFGKIAKYLTDELGIEVKYIPVKSYSASVEAFKNNQVQLAWFGGLSGVKARLSVPGSQAIAQGKNDPNFKTYFIAHKSTSLSWSNSFPKEIKNNTFTFGSKGSTSGRLMPEHFIREEYGKSPTDIFRRVGYSGDHSKTIQLVQSGAFEVGAVNYKVWKKELSAGKVNLDIISVIWETPGYPDYNWSIRGDVDSKFGDGFLKKVQKALLNLTDKDILNQFPRESFIEATNDMFNPVLETAQKVGIIPK
ncbi:MAG: putative selenate ABC transporter substrate-binding protein [Candidatus Marinimicrobia bacterium]|nr:putative selenate ABC transporter substrate-binding protein [Candidatus Neomarinimicrobiota bacterium]|tara:strand:+ start:4354 stop:5211 length:858 start_codon:yes stop_codon:yes gene_type:complete